MVGKNNGAKLLSGRRYELHIPHRVRFMYKGEKIPVSHRYVLYWQYNKAGNGFNIMNNCKNYWRDNGYHMPIGLGLTDNEGFLKPISHPPGFSISNTAYDKNHRPADRTVSYQRPDMANKHKRKEVMDLVTAADYSSIRTATRFTPNDVAFMLLPVDNPNMQMWQSKDLMQLAETSPMVVKTSITKDDQPVQLPCPLNEWDQRLQRQNIRLEESISRYQKIIAPHLAEIAKLDNMRHFQQILYRYPLHKSQRDRTGCQALIARIKDMQQAISEQYITNTASNTHCGAAQAEIIQEGEQLFELLNHAGLRAEFKRYLPYLDGGANNKNNEQLVAGPDSQQESDWRGIYETLKNSYGMLATAPESLSSRVFNEHVDPMLDFFLALGADLQAKDGIDEAFARHYNDAVGKSKEKNTLLVYLLSEWLKNTYGHVANSPGPPSLGMAIIDAYGVFIASKFDPVLHKQEAARSFRLLIGLMTMLNWGNDVGFNMKREIYNSLKSKDIAAGHKKITDYLEKLSIHSRLEKFTLIFKGLMLVYAHGTFQHAWQTSTLNTWYEWSKMLSASADLSMAGMGAAASVVRFFNASWAGAFADRVEISGRWLGVVSGLATMISSGINAKNYLNRGDIYGVGVAGISAFGSAAVTLTYIVGYILFGLTLSVSSALIIAAIAVSFFEPTALYLRNYFRDTSQQTFYAMLNAFEKNPIGKYQQSYSDNQIIVKALNNIVAEAYQVNWWNLSWRAIVPLYESGVVSFKGGDRVNLEKTARLIGNAIEIPKPTLESRFERRQFTNTNIVMGYIENYESIKRDENNQHGQCGNSVHDWLQGIAMPFVQPPPIYEEAI